MPKPAAPVHSPPAAAPDEPHDQPDGAAAPTGKRRLAFALAIVALGLALVGMLAIAITNLLP